MTKRYIVKDNDCGEIYHMTLPAIIKEINRDRSDEWSPYNDSDWREGLTEWTSLEIVGFEYQS